MKGSVLKVGSHEGGKLARPGRAAQMRLRAAPAAPEPPAKCRVFRAAFLKAGRRPRRSPCSCPSRRSGRSQARVPRPARRSAAWVMGRRVTAECASRRPSPMTGTTRRRRPRRRPRSRPCPLRRSPPWPSVMRPSPKRGPTCEVPPTTYSVRPPSAFRPRAAATKQLRPPPRRAGSSARRAGGGNPPHRIGTIVNGRFLDGAAGRHLELDRVLVAVRAALVRGVAERRRRGPRTPCRTWRGRVACRSACAWRDKSPTRLLPVPKITTRSSSAGASPNSRNARAMSTLRGADRGRSARIARHVVGDRRERRTPRAWRKPRRSARRASPQRVALFRTTRPRAFPLADLEAGGTRGASSSARSNRGDSSMNGSSSCAMKSRIMFATRRSLLSCDRGADVGVTPCRRAAAGIASDSMPSAGWPS